MRVMVFQGRFRNGRRQIAFVHDRVSLPHELFGQSGDAERGRPHVDAAAIAAKVQGNANHVDRLHFLYLRPSNLNVTDIPSPEGDTMVVITAGES